MCETSMRSTSSRRRADLRIMRDTRDAHAATECGRADSGYRVADQGRRIGPAGVTKLILGNDIEGNHHGRCGGVSTAASPTFRFEKI